MGSILILADDIFFLAKIRETVQRADVALRITSSADAFREEVGRSVPSLAIIDLNLRAAPLEAIRNLRAAHSAVRIIGYVSHVQVELAAEARSAGCNEVMPRSKFTQELANLLRAGSIEGDAADSARNGRI